MKMEKTPLERWISEKTGNPEPLDPERLRQYQLSKLRETLALARDKSRFYRERLRKISPESVATLEDVSRLPFTCPEDIAACPTDFLCVSPSEIGRIVTLATSGTTGRPKRIFFTEADQELTIDFFHRGMMTLTGEGDRVMICMPGSTEGSIGDLLSKGLSRFGCSSVIYGPIRDYDDAYDTLTGEGITAIVGIPSQILTLSRHRGKAGPPLKPQLRSILLSADYVPVSVSRWLQEVWGAKVYEHYGMTEMGLGGGVACEAREGYHLREADLLFEVIDPGSGQPVPDGVYGEVVFSTLTRSGMPLLRYRTGDRSRFLTEPCPCGTVLRRLDRITGRIRDVVTLRSGETLSITQLDELLLDDPTVTAFKAELTERDGSDCLRLTVAGGAGASDQDRLSGLLRPLLGSPIDEGRLKIEFTGGDVDFFTTGTLKRRIIDTRNFEGRSGSL